MILIGVGNGWRGDDGAGLALARRVRERAPSGVEVREVEGDATALMDAWSGAEHVVVVDAAQSEAAPGTVRRFDAGAAALPVRALRSSTHAFGVSDAVELARALGRLPDRLDGVVPRVIARTVSAGEGDRRRAPHPGHVAGVLGGEDGS